MLIKPLFIERLRRGTTNQHSLSSQFAPCQNFPGVGSATGSTAMGTTMEAKMLMVIALALLRGNCSPDFIAMSAG